MKIKTVGAIILVAILLTVFVGCGGAATQPTTSAPAASAPAAAPAASAPAAQPAPANPPAPDVSLEENPTPDVAKSEQSRSAQIDYPLSTYTVEYQNHDGYIITAQMSVGKWLKASDPDVMQQAWETIGGSGAPPDLAGFGDQNVRNDKSVVAFGDLTLFNKTPGFDITSESPLETRIFLDNSGNKTYMAISYSNGLTRLSSTDPWRLVFDALMTSNQWNVKFVLALPDIFTPNTPDGDEENLNKVFIMTSRTYNSLTGKYDRIDFHIEKWWEL